MAQFAPSCLEKGADGGGCGVKVGIMVDGVRLVIISHLGFGSDRSIV